MLYEVKRVRRLIASWAYFASCVRQPKLQIRSSVLRRREGLRTRPCMLQSWPLSHQGIAYPPGLCVQGRTLQSMVCEISSFTANNQMVVKRQQHVGGVDASL
jgi:hypothetical protein